MLPICQAFHCSLKTGYKLRTDAPWRNEQCGVKEKWLNFYIKKVIGKKMPTPYC